MRSILRVRFFVSVVLAALLAFPPYALGAVISITGLESLTHPPGVWTASDAPEYQWDETYDWNPSIVGNVPGTASWDSEVRGDYLYVADNAGALLIFSGASSGSLSTESFTPLGFAGARDVTLAYPYAYVACGTNGLRIVDVSDPAAPTLMGSFDTSGTAVSVEVVGSIAYVADFENGFSIIDVTLPLAPTVIGSYDTAGWAQDVDVIGSVAYVADEGNLRVFDVSDPANPSLTSSNAMMAARSLDIEGSYLYVADGGNGVRVFDISTPAGPAEVGSRSIGGQATAVTVSGTKAYATDSLAGSIALLDVSDPVIPRLLGKCDTPGDSWSTSVSGTIAYVSDRLLGVQVIDCSRPTGLSLAGNFSSWDGGYWHAGYDLTLVGDTAVMAGADKGLYFIDVSDSSSPSQISNLAIGGNALGVASRGATILAATTTGGLVVVDGSNPAAPSVVATLAVADARDLEVLETSPTAVIANGANGVRIVDFSNPSTPTVIADWPMNGYCRDVAVKGTVGYFGDTSGIDVVDLSDPSNPSLITTLEGTKWSVDLSISEDWLYSAATTQGMFIFDISTPGAPVEIGSYIPAEDIQAVGGMGSVAFIGLGTREVRLVDFSDPTRPLVLGADSSDVEYPYDIVVAGGKGYAPAGLEGISIFSAGVAVDYSFELAAAMGIPDATADGSNATTTLAGSAEGQWYFNVRGRVGIDWSETATSTLTLIDVSAPLGTVQIDGGAAVTTETAVDLQIAVGDTYSGAAQMRLSNDGVFDTESWEPTATTKSWALDAGDGGKTVYVQFKDVAGNVSGSVSDSIVLDSAPPVLTNDTLTVDEDTTATVGAPGLLGNDSDLTAVTNATVVTPPAGNLVLDADGSYEYRAPANFNGTDTFTYKATDGFFWSDPATVTITVNPMNDAPSFTCVAVMNLLEDAAPYSGVRVTDISVGPANEVAQTYAFETTNDNNALFSVQPTVSALGNLTFTVAPDVFGSATVTVKMTDDDTMGGAALSATHTFLIAVASVNDAPTFTNGGPVTVAEDSGAYGPAAWASGMSAGPANESGQSLAFETTNSAPALFSVQPSVAANGDLSFTPAANANGSVVCTVTLTDDGTPAASKVETFAITISSVNDLPVANNDGPYTFAEGTGAWFLAYNVLANDTDVEGPRIPELFTDGTYGQCTMMNADGTFVYYPVGDYYGPDAFTYRIYDGVAYSNIATVSLTITPVNDAPSIDGPDVTVNEDSGVYSAAWATALSVGPANESAQSLTLQTTNDNNALFSVQPTVAPDGTLTFTPAANAYGTASVTTTITDDATMGGSALQDSVTFTITVNSVNDLPVANNDGPYAFDEGTGAWFLAYNILSNDSDVEGPMTAQLFTDGTYGQCTTMIAGGTFVYYPVGDYNGPDAFTYRVYDGEAYSNVATVTLTINPINDAPSFSKGANQMVAEDSVGQTVAGWATAISCGPANEAGQSLTFNVANDNNALFSVQPTLAVDGTLSYTPAANAFGAATVSVSLTDDDTKGGAALTSAVQTFTVTISSANDAPAFTVGADQTVAEDAGAQTVVGWAPFVTAGPNESSQVLTFNASNDNNSLFSAQPTVSASGTLYYTPAPNANGTATVTLSLTDDDTMGGGALTTAEQTFTITVTPVNDTPVFDVVTDVNVDEDSGAYSAVKVTGMSVGPANESAQTHTIASSYTNASLFSVPPTINAGGTLSFTPAADANGLSSVTVTMTDDASAGGPAASFSRTFNIVVNAVNDMPSFGKPSDFTDDEDAPSSALTFWVPSISAGPANEAGQSLTFNVTNNNNALFTSQPSINANGWVFFEPAPDAYGSAVISLSLTDDATKGGAALTSAEQTFTITISPVNDAPLFTSGGNVAVIEDSGAYGPTNWASGISAGPNESGQGLAWTLVNSDNSLFSVQPALNAAGQLSFATSLNTTGSAICTATLTDDGTPALSKVATFTITILDANDAPVASDDGYSVDEDTLLVAPHSLIANDSDADGDVLFAIPASAPTTGTLSEWQTAGRGLFNYMPAANFNGTATFTYRAFDGQENSNVATCTITVNPLNDTPSFTKGANQTVAEDANPQVIAGWATSISPGPANEAGQVLTFNVSNDNNALFSAQPAVASNGQLTYTPAPNANGVATVSVSLTDDASKGGPALTSPVQTFTITVNAVNDIPSFVKGANQTVDEDAGAQTVAGWATSISPGAVNEAGQALTFNVSNDNNALFSAQPAVASNGTLTFTPAADANGVATVSVSLTDDNTMGGVERTTAIQTFTITVNAVNDTPSFTKGADQTVDEDAAAQNVAAWATAISAGPANEAGQALTFNVSTDAPSLFSVQPAVAANGTLTYTPAPDANGVASVLVSLTDDATKGGGALTTGGQTFTITVNAVNDMPSFTKGANQTVDEDVAAQTVATWATAISAGPANEAGQALTFNVTNDNNALFSAQPAIASNGTLTYTPAADANGVATVSVSLTDDATKGGAALTTAVQTFTITVNAVNDMPGFVKGANQTLDEDAAAQTVATWATAISAGPANEAGQALTFNVTNDNNALFSTQPAIASTGQLTYTPAADANGMATVSVSLTDDATTGGAALTTAIQTFTITVNAVNDAPSFTKGSDVTVAEDYGAYWTTWATSISRGPSNESAQLLSFETTNSNPSLFSVQPSISTTGALMFTTAPDANGSADVTVTLTDDATAGGAALSRVETLTITLTPVDDATKFIVTSKSVTLSAYGQTYRFSARFTDSAGTPIPGKRVILQSSSINTGYADTSLAATTAADGSFSFTVRPRARTYYRARFQGEATQWISSMSSPVCVTPRVLVSAPAAPTYMYTGSRVRIAGTLRPRHTAGTAAVRIYRYRYESGAWRSYGYVLARLSDTSTYSTYSAYIALPSTGKWALRAYVPADAGHAASWSAYDYVTVSTPGDRAVAIARSYTGYKYLWGGSGPVYFDASGFTQFVFRKNGVYIPRKASDQARVGTYVTRSQLRPGDLVFFYTPISHVGIYVGNGHMIDCNRPAGSVGIRKIYPSFRFGRRVW